MNKKNTGYLHEEEQLQDASYEAVFGAPSDWQNKPSRDWREHMPKFRYQGALPTCFAPHQKVLMEDFEYKKIRDIKKGEYVYTHLGKIKQVLETMKRKWQGNIYHIQFFGQYEELECTGEHPIYTYRNGTYLFVEAKDLTEDDYVFIPSIQQEKPMVSKKIYEDNRFLYLLGWYLADGYADEKRQRIIFTLGTKKERYVETIVKNLKELFDLDAKIYHTPERNRIDIDCSCGNNQYMFKSFTYAGGKFCWNKKIAKEFLFLPPEKQKQIMTAWIQGDGYVNEKKPVVTGTTVSEELAKQMHRLFLRNGIACCIEKRKEEEGKRQAYNIKIYGEEINKFINGIGYKSETGNAHRVRYVENGMLAKIKNINTKVYSRGYVYNLEVEDDHSYVVENIAVHNCVSHATTAVSYALNKVYDDERPTASPLWLFFESGGSVYGSYTSKNADIARNKGIVFETDKPYKDIAFNEAKKYALIVDGGALKKAEYNRFKNYSRVAAWNKNTLKDALEYSPLVIGLYTTSGYWNKLARYTSQGYGHAIVLTYIDEKDNYYVFDSLTYKKGFDGHHTFHSSYPLLSAYSYRDLPDDWKNINKENKLKQLEGKYIIRPQARGEVYYVENGEARYLPSDKDSNKRIPLVEKVLRELARKNQLIGISESDFLAIFG